MLGRADGIAPRRIHDENALARGGICVDIVDTNAGAADHAQLRRRLQQLRIRLHRRADDKPISIGQLCGQPVLNLISSHNLPSSLLLEDSSGSRRDFFSDNNLHIL